MTSWSAQARAYVLLVLVVLVVALPFVFRQHANSGQIAAAPASVSDSLVIITPHLEAVRRKFGRAFSQWYAQKYHRAVNIEYLSFGGGDIIRFFQAS